MKLLSCHADGFGCLKNYSVNFSENPTCIFADNGTGKTTLTVFIKSMFYGLCGDGKRNETESERKKYKPWDLDVFGGTLEFESSKGKFRIERYFGKKASDDSFKLTDLSTGAESSAYSENVGVELFGIDVESYEKSTFMPQHSKDVSMTTSISTKLGALLEASSDAESYDAAVSLLEKYMRDLKLFKGKGGRIAELEDEKFSTENRISELEKALCEKDEKSALLEEIETRITEAAQKAKELDEKLEKAKNDEILLSKIEQYEKAKEEIARNKQQYEKIASANGKKLPERQEIKEVLSFIEKLEDKRNRVSSDTDEFGEYEKRFGDFSKATEKAKKIRADLERKPKSTKNYLYAAVGGGIIVAIGLVLCFFYPFVGLPICAVGAAVAAAGAFLFVKTKKEAKEIENTKIAAERELVSLGYADGADISDFERDLNRYSFLINTAASKKDEIRKTELEIKELSEKIDAFCEKYGVENSGDLCGALEALNERIDNAEKVKISIETAENYWKKYAEENSISDGMKKPEISDELKRERADVGKTSEELNGYAGRLRESIKNLEEATDELPTLRYKSERLSAEIKEYTEKRETAELALEYLKDAKTSLSSRYLGKTKSNFEEIYAEITEKEPKTEIDTDLNLSFREAGGYKNNKVYSEGLRAVSAICMRIALSKSIFGDEPVFLILDDPFTDLDGKKLERATAMLRKLSENYQIIYTTCHESRKI